MRLTDKDDKVKVVTLDDSNYAQWSTAMKFKLMHKGYWISQIVQQPFTPKPRKVNADGSISVIFETAEEVEARVPDSVKEKDEKALGLIGEYCNATHQDEIADCRNAYEAWKKLADLLQGKDAQQLAFYRDQFAKTKMEHDESALQYLMRLEKLQKKCTGTEAPITEIELCIKAVNSMPENWDVFVTSYRSNPANLKNWEKLKQDYTTEWQRMNPPQDYRIQVEQSANYTEKKRKFDYECHNCHKKGHLKRDCFKEGGGKYKGTKQVNVTEKKAKEKRGGVYKAVFLATRINSDRTYADVLKFGKEASRKISNAMEAFNVESSKSTSGKWIVDSGATDHMTCENNSMKNMKNVKSSVSIADESILEVTGVGSVESNGLTLKNVWYVPKLSKNLISVAAIDKAGHKVEFSDGRVKIISKNGNLLAIGKLKTVCMSYKWILFLKDHAIPL